MARSVARSWAKPSPPARPTRASRRGQRGALSMAPRTQSREPRRSGAARTKCATQAPRRRLPRRGRNALLRPEPLHWTRQYSEAQLAVYDHVRMLDSEQAWRVVRMCCFGDLDIKEALAPVTQSGSRPSSRATMLVQQVSRACCRRNLSFSRQRRPAAQVGRYVVWTPQAHEPRHSATLQARTSGPARVLRLGATGRSRLAGGGPRGAARSRGRPPRGCRRRSP
jgi:hypothetical protein